MNEKGDAWSGSMENVKERVGLENLDVDVTQEIKMCFK
jgi:hypothetical protein